jgi:hypothetical protein
VRQRMRDAAIVALAGAVAVLLLAVLAGGVSTGVGALAAAVGLPVALGAIGAAVVICRIGDRVRPHRSGDSWLLVLLDVLFVCDDDD